VINKAGAIINDILHSENKKLKMQSLELTKFNITDCIEKVNPVLWDFMRICTRSVRESTGKANSDDAHIKIIRRLFTISIMLFTTNPSCATTIHNLITDSVEVHGGSRKLIRILNRLGVCVSTDTHDRLVTEIAEIQKQRDVWNDMSSEIFTIASADNIDFLQTHTAVYCGDKSRSYHGTTVQLVQPVPSIKFDTGSIPCTCVDETITPENISLLKRALDHSPSASPHKLGKLGPKRRRTLQLSPLAKQPSDKQPFANLAQHYVTYHEKPNLEESQFLESSEPGMVLKPLRKFLLPSRAQLVDHDPSVIYYMELIDENCDSEETMTHVAELVLEKLHGQEWAIYSFHS
jgi:hypothetical protein